MRQRSQRPQIDKACIEVSLAVSLRTVDGWIATELLTRRTPAPAPLPHPELVMPCVLDQARRITWESLSEASRENAEEVL